MCIKEEGFDMCFVDGDSILYKIAATTDSHIQARERFNTKIKEIMEETGAAKGFVAVKGEGNFRLDLTDTYKANRKKYPLKPDMAIRLKRLYTYAYRTGCVPSDKCEADDLVTIWSEEATANEQSFVIAHIDKDIDQYPGCHYNYNKNTHYIISEDEGNLLFCKQLLTGDSSDNIKGLKGIGPVTASKLLAVVPKDSRLDTIKRIWCEREPEDWEARLTLCANLVYMRRSFDDIRELTLEEMFNG